MFMIMKSDWRTLQSWFVLNDYQTGWMRVFVSLCAARRGQNGLDRTRAAVREPQKGAKRSLRGYERNDRFDGL